MPMFYILCTQRMWDGILIHKDHPRRTLHIYHCIDHSGKNLSWQSIGKSKNKDFLKKSGFNCRKLTLGLG